MIMGMNDAEATEFLERVSATAITNQAVLKCAISGRPVTPDAVILCVGDFIDPTRPNFQGLIGRIEIAIDELFSTADQRGVVSMMRKSNG